MLDYQILSSNPPTNIHVCVIRQNAGIFRVDPSTLWNAHRIFPSVCYMCRMLPDGVFTRQALARFTGSDIREKRLCGFTQLHSTTGTFAFLNASPTSSHGYFKFSKHAYNTYHVLKSRVKNQVLFRAFWCKCSRTRHDYRESGLPARLHFSATFLVHR